MRADAHFDRRSDLLPVNKRSEAGVRVNNRAAAFVEAKLGVLARDHRPLFLRKEIVTNGGVAADDNFLAGERALTLQLATAIFCENYLHGFVAQVVNLRETG